MFKKIIGSLLAVAMLASMGTTVFAAELTTEQQNGTDISISSPKWFTSFVTQSVVLRSGAGNNYSSLGTLQKKETVEPTAETAVDSSGMDWVEVYSPRLKKTGWVPAKYVADEGM